MFEVTLIENGIVMGDWDIPAESLVVGGVWDGMEILSIEWSPSTGEDAIVVVRFVFE
jgi:hypothetical protein